ncbi:Uncharacterised protein [Vibrio cholerae]|nr:Uncharacterised protein [Vibrio cholerae]
MPQALRCIMRSRLRSRSVNLSPSMLSTRAAKSLSSSITYWLRKVGSNGARSSLWKVLPPSV